MLDVAILLVDDGTTISTRFFWSIELILFFLDPKFVPFETAAANVEKISVSVV